MHGTNISINSEVTNISSIGFWVLIEEKEYFIAFDEYPVFKNISIIDIFDVKMISQEQLYWEKHDIDIEVSALKNPDKFKLLFKK